jgi:sugar transferase (PEP-CTERM/EpsH1 system associated)
VTNTAPLVVHIIYRLDIGGLENGLVNLINNFPAARYRHAIICLTEFTEFRKRIRRDDVEVVALHKREGKDLHSYFRLWKLLRRLKPVIAHTRNVGTLDCQVVALLAGVKHRVHGEHGREIGDVDGTNVKLRRRRRVLAPFVERFITMSRDLESWLSEEVGIAPGKIRQIYSGVDDSRFAPPAVGSDPVPVVSKRFADDAFIIGSVGRMDPVKDQLTLVRSFERLVELVPAHKERLRLVHIGDGPMSAEIERFVAGSAEIKDLVWLPGARDDIPELLRAMNVFVLPSLGEGISNTIIEAMACGLPVIATNVGGNIELVEQGVTGQLVPPADPEAMAQALARYLTDPKSMKIHGDAARARVKRDFSLSRMVEQYVGVYDEVCSGP